MPTPCCVPNCKSNYTKNSPKISVFSFPRDENMRKAWISAIKRRNFVPTKYSKVCAKHFRSNQFLAFREGFNASTGELIQVRLEYKRLAPGAIPSILPNSSEPSKSRENPDDEAKIKSSEIDKEEEKKDHIPLDAPVKIKEEPVDYTSIPSTSNNAANQEFILPQEDNSWTTSNSVVEPQFSLSVACLASPYEPETSDCDQLQKKRKINPSNPSECPQSIIGDTLLLNKTNCPEVRPQSPVDNFGESPTPGSSKEPHKDVPVKIKEEPADYVSILSTSNDATNQEFILPKEENPWTTLNSSAEPQFTLSLVSLASSNGPETSDGEQLKKKRKINPAKITTSTTFMQPTTNGPEVRQQSPVYNFGESSTPSFTKEPHKDHFDVFGEFIAAKLRSLDRRSCAFAQKAIADIIFEADMGKYLKEELSQPQMTQS